MRNLHFLLIIHTGGLLQIKVPCSLKYVFRIAKVNVFLPYPIFFSSPIPYGLCLSIFTMQEHFSFTFRGLLPLAGCFWLVFVIVRNTENSK